ncbi:MAG: IS110 family transposase [Candidatus Marinimicrobia bacterium]|nr:IS110 family transposase [Candidatus Neomarinimicrobiota bacterium]
MFFCGIDWSDREFVIVIVNEQGDTLKSFVVVNNADGFQELVNRIRIITPDQDKILISIETPNSPLVDYLMDEGYTVYAINPKAVDRYRDRYRTSKAKDDFFDAMVLANILRTDRNRHRPIASGSDLLRELKILTQDRETFVQTQTKFTNQLRSCLKAYYPEACRLFKDLNSPSALTFLKLFPTWKALHMKNESQIIRMLKKHRVNTPSLLKKILKHAKTSVIPINSVLKKTKARQMVTLVEQLALLGEQIKTYDSAIEHLLDKHQDKDIFLSLPGAGSNLSSRLLSQLGDDRSRYQCVEEVRPLAGTAPVTKQSGNYKNVTFRFGCRKAFRNALQLFAFCSLTRSQWAYHYYQKHREMGKTHNHALRLLADKWLKIIFAMWKKYAVYDERIFLADMVKHAMNQRDYVTVLQSA